MYAVRNITKPYTVATIVSLYLFAIVVAIFFLQHT